MYFSATRRCAGSPRCGMKQRIGRRFAAIEPPGDAGGSLPNHKLVDLDFAGRMIGRRTAKHQMVAHNQFPGRESGRKHRSCRRTRRRGSCELESVCWRRPARHKDYNAVAPRSTSFQSRQRLFDLIDQAFFKIATASCARWRGRRKRRTSRSSVSGCSIRSKYRPA